ncbi:30653_t:CDS:2, partial [Gigaspora margarita]
DSLSENKICSKAIEEDQTMFETIQNETDEYMNNTICRKALGKSENSAGLWATPTKEGKTAELQEILAPAQAKKLTLKGDNPQPSSHANAGQGLVVAGPVTPKNRIDIQNGTDIEGFTT